MQMDDINYVTLGRYKLEYVYRHNWTYVNNLSEQQHVPYIIKHVQTLPTIENMLYFEILNVFYYK